MPARESIIESLRGIINLQILTIEKTLQSLDNHLETRHQDDIQQVVTSMTRSVHDLMTRMIKSSRSGSRSLLAQSSWKRARMFGNPRIAQIHQSMSTKVDPKRKWAIFADGNASFRDNLAQPLSTLVTLLRKSHLKTKAMAWRKWAGRSSIMHTSDLDDEDSGRKFNSKPKFGKSQYPSESLSVGVRKNHNYNSKVTTEIDDEMDDEYSESKTGHYRFNQSSYSDDEDPFPMLDEEDLVVQDDDEEVQDDEDDRSRDESPELFNASSGEPIESNGFYDDYWLTGGQVAGTIPNNLDYDVESQEVGNSMEKESLLKQYEVGAIQGSSEDNTNVLPSAADFIRRTSSSEMILAEKSNNPPSPILQKKPADNAANISSNRSSKRVTFQDPSLTLLNQLEKEMMPLFELSKADGRSKNALETLSSSQKFLRNTSFFQPDIILRANYDTIPPSSEIPTENVNEEDFFKVVDSTSIMQDSHDKNGPIDDEANLGSYEHVEANQPHNPNPTPSYQFVKHHDHAMMNTSNLDDEELSGGFEMF